MISSVLLLLCLISISQCSIFDFNILRVETAQTIPYQVSLQSAYSNSHFCSGALLTDSFIITAAHCVDNRTAPEIIAVVGVVDLIQINPSRSISQVRQIIKHKEYLRDSWRNNVAVLRVDAFPRRRAIQPVRIHTPDSLNQTSFLDDQQLTLAFISGYGRLERIGFMLNELHVAPAVVVHPSHCEHFDESDIFNTQICAYDPLRFNTTRIVDMGSPLIIDEKLAGIASHSRDHRDYSIVFTFIPPYSSWLFTQIVW